MRACVLVLLQPPAMSREGGVVRGLFVIGGWRGREVDEL